MAFTTENRKIENIFQRSALYIVPRYQRDYVWKEVNWKELWIDLQFTLNNAAEIPWSHFLGTIVLSRTNEKLDGIDKYEIIDGQQRLMTLYLLLIAVYKNYKKLPENDKRNISQFIFETFLTSLTKESTRKIMLDNELYNEDLQIILDAATNGYNIDKKNKLYSPFSYFDNNLKDKDVDYLDKFLSKLQSVNVVEIISDEDEEIYNIFEVLNARGQKLKQIELLKNHIMKYIQPRENEFIDQAKRKWRNIQNNIEHLNDPDYLIQHFAKCYIEKNAENQNSIYRLIKEEIKIDDLNKFLEKLEEFSIIYKEITCNEFNYDAVKYFSIKRNQQIRSLLCAILVLNRNGIINEDVKNKALKQLLNFFFVFNTTQQTSNKTDKVISTISYRAYNCECQNEFLIVFSDFLYEIEQFINGKDYKTMFESNQTFKYSNKDRSLKRNGNIVKFVLSQILNKNQSDTLMETNSLTIEHLLSDDGSLNNASIWNLTLTSQNINEEELKNKSIVDKINILKDKSTIKANQSLGTYLEGGNFNFEKRKNDMLDIIFDEIFVFEPSVFNITKEDISQFYEIQEIANKNDDQELLAMLYKYGNKLIMTLDNDPKLKDLSDRFQLYRTVTRMV